MFERNLPSVIRGIRSNKNNEEKYILMVIDEIRKELKTNDIEIKANAILKLTYLQMMGYEMDWASFNVIEVMSSQRFAFKRIGYVAACQSFKPTTEVLMLATNLIKKDLASANMYDAGLALNGLANFVTPDLAHDLSSDVVSLLNNSRPYVRKKAVLALYKIFLKFPEALRPAFPRLKEKLEDPDPSVVSAAVNVICELSRKNPKNYLTLAPQLFRLLTDSSNNWMLIKIIKLFAALTPLEPRLSKKLVEPITNLVNTTPAMSLLYECINTVTQGMLDQPNLVKLCVTKLRVFIEDPDQNLKYLGLLALGRVLKDYPKLVAEHNDIILRCIEDPDISIRKRALDLLAGMVNKKNLPDVVKKLLGQIKEGSPLATDLNFRDDMIGRIIHICSQGGYQFITDFEWYLDVLVDLCSFEGTTQAKAIAAQMLDVAIRVKVIREHAVHNMLKFLNDKALLNKSNDPQFFEILYSAAWIAGEFASFIEHPAQAVEAFLNPAVKLLPGHIQAVFVHNALKIFVAIKDEDELKAYGKVMIDKLPPFAQSTHLEVQERACTILEILKLAQIEDFSHEILEEVQELFAGELNPVAPKAQKKVPVPADLDLDSWINEPLSDDEPEPQDFSFLAKGKDKDPLGFGAEESSESEDEQVLAQRRMERQEKRKHDPYYLSDSKKKPAPIDETDIDSIPIATLDLEDLPKTDRDSKKKEKDRRRRKDAVRPEINMDAGEMPEGATQSDDEDKPRKEGSYSALDNIDLTTPLGAQDALPAIKAYDSPMDIRRREEKLKEEADRRKLQELQKEEERKKRREAKDQERKSREGRKDDKSRSSRHHHHRSERSERSEHSERPHRSERKEEGKSGGSGSNGKPAEAAPKKEAAPATQDLLNFLEDIPSPAAAATPAVEKREESKEMEREKEKSERRERNKDKERERSSRHGGDRDRERDRKRDGDRDRERSSRHGSEREREKDRGRDRNEKREEERSASSSLRADLESLGDFSSQNAIPFGYSTLGENAFVRVLSKIHASHSRSNEVVVNVLLQNLSSETLSSIELNILDSLNLRSLSSKSGAVNVPGSIPSGQSTELPLRFSVQDILTPQTLKTTMTFASQGSPQKIDFRFNFPCSAFMVAAACSKSQFTALLSDPANFTAKESKVINGGSRKLDGVINAISSGLHLTVVERLSIAASLYGTSIQDHLVAMLVKQAEPQGTFTVDIKSSDPRLASNLVKELETLFS